MNKAFVKSTALILLVCFAISLILYGTYVLAQVTISGLLPSDNSYSNTSTPTFYFNASSNVSTSINCTLYINDSAYGNSEATNSSLANITANDTLADNFYLWYIDCTDDEGTNSSAPMNITIDTIAPVIGKSFTPGRNWIWVNATASDANLRNLTIFLYNSTGLVNYSTTTDANLTFNFTNLADENYSFNVTAFDYAGNSNTSSSTGTTTIDTVAPAIEFVPPTDSPGTFVNRDFIAVSINATDANQPLQLAIYLYNSTEELINTSSNTTSLGTLTANFTGLAEGLYFFNATAMDGSNLNATELRNVTLDTTAPAVILGDNFKVNEINGVNMTVVGGTDEVEIFGLVDDSNGNLKNWTINVYNNDSIFVNVACSDTSGESINGSICTWNTNLSCTDAECWNYSLQLIAYDKANNQNETWRYDILIDNIPPYIDTNATLTLETNNNGGLYSMKQWSIRVNISDTYLREVRAYVLDNNNNTVIEWGQQCNEADDDMCNQSRSGMFNKTWYADQYSINGEVVPAHNVFYFPQQQQDTNWWFVSVPGCFAETGVMENYSCYDDCSSSSGPECRPWRWHLVYNVSNFTENEWSGRLLGLVRDDWCDENGCNISGHLIDNGTSKFIPQQDSFNFSNGQWSQANLTEEITLYSIGDLSNVNLTQDMPSGNYQFAFSASDNWWGAMSSWNIYVDNELPVVNAIIINNPDNFFSPYDNMINFSVNVTDDRNVSFVQADLHPISYGACESNESNNCSYNLSYNNVTRLWDGLINVSSYIISEQLPVGTILPITAYDDSTNRNNYTNQSMADIVMHDLGVPGGFLGNNSCARFSGATTNFTKVSDFSHVNFILDLEANLSCITNGTLNVSDFRKVMLLNFSSVNLSTPEQASKVMNIPQYLNISITLPGEFENSFIGIDTTYFAQLDTNTTIELFGLPFITEPAVLADNISKLVTTTWVSNGPDPQLNVITGNLTLEVLGFSGYTILDNASPIINITGPATDELFNTGNISINFSVNGTGTEVSWVQVYVDGTGSSYHPQSNLSELTCTPETPGSELYYCNLAANLSDGLHTLNVTAYDYGGGSSPGNNATSGLTFSVDTITPPVTSVVMKLSNGSVYTNNTRTKLNVSANISATDATNVSGIYYCTSTSNSSCAPNQTYSAQINFTTEATHYLRFTANDTLGNNASIKTYVIIIDRTKPEITDISASGTSSSSSTGTATITITTDEDASCWYKDANFTAANSTTGATLLSGSGTSHTFGIGYSSDGTIGPYYVSCRDTAGNAMTTSNSTGQITVSVTEGSTGGSHTSSGYYGNATINGTLEIIFRETLVTLGKNEYLRFPIKNLWHRCTLISVGNGSVTFSVESTPKQVTVKEGEYALVDVTDDGNADVNITVVKIYSSGATVRFSPVEQPVATTPVTPPIVTPTVPPVTPPAQNASVVKNETTPAPSGRKLPLVWAYVILVAILGIIAFFIYSVMSRKKTEQ